MDASSTLSKQPANPQTGLRFCLLGPPIITWNDIPLVIPRRSVRALLYRLACDPEPVTRGNLHLLFWPDVPEAVARRNLSHHLTHLRRSLPLKQVLVADSERVWLEPGSIWCDVLQFNKAPFDSPFDISCLTQTAGLYRGPFLEGFDLPGCREFEHWCIVERVALENQYLKILGHLVKHCTNRGETGQAILYAQHYLETDPLSEAMHQRLIQLYAAAGDRHLALQQFERCSSVLESELGVSPLPETSGIYQAVLHSQLRFPRPPAPLRHSKQPDWEVPILGRKKELGLLEEAFLNLQSRRSQVVLISGEAGIGKSRLMHEFAQRHPGEAQLLYGASRAGEQVIPYQPVLDALRSILGLREPGMEEYIDNGAPGPSPTDLIEPVWLSEISRLLPEIHSVYPGLPSPLPLEPECAHARLFEALCRLLLAYATAHGPLLLCLDDLQWMDASTQAWLIHIGRLFENGRYPILILGTYRSEEANAILDLRHTLARAGVLVEIKLLGLREAAVLELLQSLAGQRPGEEVLARRLHQATGGNPFYLIEILRQLIDEGRLEEQFHGPMQFNLPQSIRDAIQARLDRLSPIARQVLEAGAVSGQSFGIDLLRLTAGRSHVEIISALEELVARILLVEARQEFRFMHELIRQHVEENLGQVRRELLHRRAGRTLQRLQPDAYSTLAHHFELGGDPQKALFYHQQAARGAQALFAWQAAEFHQGRMLGLLALIDPGCALPELIRQRANILAERAHSRYLLGQLAERDIDLAALFDLGEASDNDQIRLETIFHRLRYLNLDGEYSQAISVAEKGLALLRTSHLLFGDADQERVARSRLLAQIGFAYYFLGMPLEALGVLEDARALCGESAEPEACGRIMHILGYVYFHLGDYPRSLECQQCAYNCHQEAGDNNRMAWDLIDIGALHKNLGDPARARRFLEEGLGLAQRVGALPAEAYGLAHYGSMDLYQGNYAAAAAHYHQVLEMQQAIHSDHIIATAEAGIGFASYHLGDYVQSRSWLERALQRARASGHRRRIAETLIQLGLLDMEEACLSFARQHLEEGLAIAQDCQSGEGLSAGLAALARLERLAGDSAHALELAVEAVCAAEQTGLACCEMWGEIEAGLACLSLGDLTSAQEHTQRAASLAPQASQDWIGREEAHRAHARVLRALGQDKVAAEHEQLVEEIIQAKVNLILDKKIRSQYLKSKSRSTYKTPY